MRRAVAWNHLRKLNSEGHTLDSLPIDPGVAYADTNLDFRLNADLICFSHLRWDFVTQRPQHLLTRAARDRRVFYWEEPIWHQPEDPSTAVEALEKRIEVTSPSANVWVIRPHIHWGIDFEVGQRALLDEFVREFRIEHAVGWYYTPMALGFSSHMKFDAVVYDCMDELSAFAGAPPRLAQRERELLAAADVVFTGGYSLYDAKRTQHANVHAFPSSVDVAHFAAAKNRTDDEPADQSVIAHPRAGFFGVLDERLDIALVAEVAKLRPEMQFVLIGPVVKIDPATLPVADNIHYPGSKTYANLPDYLAGWDVAMLPFAMNEATRFISPTKTPEYLAAGKTVVSTPICDVVRQYGDAGLVAIAGTAREFAAALDAALLPQPEAWKTAVAEALALSSWDSTWAAMNLEIAKVMRTPGKHEEVKPCVEVELTVEVNATVRMDTALSLAHFNRRSEKSFDYLVVGAGFAGSVLAERLASQLGKRVVIIDKRDHVGGNAYDHYNESGILIHKYGPHIFHTNSQHVVDYLSQFTEWRPYEHRVLASVAGQLLPIPINLDTVNRLYGLGLDAEGMRRFLEERVVACSEIRTSEEIVKSRVGVELYELFFRNYTRKQWGLDPSQLDASVAGRVPVRFDRDDRYFSDSFQAMPLKGYTPMFERMLDHANITIQTETTYDEAIRMHPRAQVVYTGAIDEYFGFRFGPLPYRSLEFKHETIQCERYQQAPVVNFPNDHAYTRVTEFKYLTGQEHERTSLVYEYPKDDGDPYYPIPRTENAALYAKYFALAQLDKRVTFCGRLATYRYLNMDQVVAQALAAFMRIADAEDKQVAPRNVARRAAYRRNRVSASASNSAESNLRA